MYISVKKIISENVRISGIQKKYLLSNKIWYTIIYMNDSRFEKMIIERLKEKNWTQAELAEALKVEYKNRNPTMNFYIHGKRLIPRDKFVELCKVLAPQNDPDTIEKYTKQLASAYMEFLENDPRQPEIPRYLHDLIGNTYTKYLKSLGVVVAATLAAGPFGTAVAGGNEIFKHTKSKFNRREKFNQTTNNDNKTYNGPFGLRMGLTLEEIKSVCLLVEDTETGVYKIIPKKTHSAFNSYEIAYDEEYGLYSINAKSEPMENKLCSERFNSLKEKMEKGYGTSRSFNAEDIEDGVTWDVQSGNQKFVANNLNSIFLTISKTQDDNAQISILYNFNNINDLASRVEDEWL